MTHRTAVINVVGLSRSLLGDDAPNLQKLATAGRLRRLEPVLPAVTCSVQASMLTGRSPRDHGIVGNGYYHRELAEVHFWKQSNHLVKAEQVWDTARKQDASVTTANVGWWFNMYSSVDYSVTPRPVYKADGRKLPDCYSEPAELRDRLQSELGMFPLFQFWGPGASIASSKWLADAAMRIAQWHDPTLLLVYLPHLDYALQKFGPGHATSAKALREIDSVAGRLIDGLRARDYRIIVLSEYGIEAVDGSVAVNRLLREAGGLRVREEDGHEMLDPGASDAFAVADHQVAHVYVKDRARIAKYAELCRGLPGVGQVLGKREQKAAQIDHERSGELVLVAEQGKWFSYPYWRDDRKAPDFARTVEIHRKPGYDPLELFMTGSKLALSWKLLKRKLGMRTLLDVIPLDESLVKGSHGRPNLGADLDPVLITEHDDGLDEDRLACTSVREVILSNLLGEPAVVYGTM